MTASTDESRPGQSRSGSRPDRRTRRFPQWVYRHGVEPDPRFSLANERTFLAWVRTSLALVAGGVALEAMDVPLTRELRLFIAITFILLGLLAVGQAWLGWARTERALRAQRALPPPSLAPFLTVGVILGAFLLGLGLLR